VILPLRALRGIVPAEHEHAAMSTMANYIALEPLHICRRRDSPERSECATMKMRKLADEIRC